MCDNNDYGAIYLLNKAKNNFKELGPFMHKHPILDLGPL